MSMAKPRHWNTKRWAWLAAALIAAVVAILAACVPLHRQNKSCYFAQKYTGLVEDCCCDYETVDYLNVEVLHPLLQVLVKMPFFRYFKCAGIKFLFTAGCVLRIRARIAIVVMTCVCECSENEFPEPFKKQASSSLSADDLACQEGKPQAIVDRTIDTKAFRGWVEVDNPWTCDNETDNGEMTYVNLQLNPERFTGYTGPSARRIWDAIYRENCPKYPDEEACPEKKVLYKLISGLHASISIHISADYLLDETRNVWGQNLTLMYDRVLKYPECVRNLYFTFLFVLRAVIKARDYLEQANYDTGNPEEDFKTKSLVGKLLNHPKLQAACPVPFNEAELWKIQGEPKMIEQIQKQFRNISALMDCVGCEKCRLWGKLQILGLGTALKILFFVDGPDDLGHTLHLQRNEVIALINLLSRLSESIKFIHDMGPAVETVMQGQIAVATAESCPWKRFRASILG